jgi:hypothetical protein
VRRLLAWAALAVAPAAWAADALTYRAIDAYGRRLEVGSFVLERNGAARITSARGVDPARVQALAASDLRMRPERLAVGETWQDQATRIDRETGTTRTVRLTGRVRGTETITTRAGTFEVLVIERVILLGDAGRYRTETRRTEREWYSPQLDAPVRTEVWEEWNDTSVPRVLQNQLTRNRELYELVGIGPGSAGNSGS